MATTSPATDRAHKAGKRYIYAWGGGTAEGDGGMKAIGLEPEGDDSTHPYVGDVPAILTSPAGFERPRSD
jgi:hypothetical protein